MGYKEANQKRRGKPRLFVGLVTVVLSAFVWMNAVLANPDPGTGIPGSIIRLQVIGPIGPASSDYISRGLDQAVAENARLVILQIDTPGGLDVAMRDIIKKIIASPIPVASWVAPGGARAASAGTYILYASHVAAMAPATNLGAATPVQLTMPSGSDGKPGKDSKSEGATANNGNAMQHKIVNDAVAYIRGLAKLHGRNADWAEKAVRGAASLPAEEALNLKVIDLMAADTRELVGKLQGRSIAVNGHLIKLDLADAQIDTVEPDWRNRLLAAIANPNIAYVLLMIGVYGLMLEFYHPGTAVPGTIGAISLLLALYALQALSVNYVGIALLLLGVALMVAETFVPSFGVLGIGGIAAFVIGSIMFTGGGEGPMAVSPAIIGSFAVTGALICLVAIRFAIRARNRPVVSGREQLIGGRAKALEAFSQEGRVLVHSEVWNAHTCQPVLKGQAVAIDAIDGLRLQVHPINDDQGD